MKSLLRYPGGKTRAIKILEKFIPEDTKEVVSPFFGGGSFEFNLAKKGIKVIGYDKFEHLTNFWKTVFSDKEKLYEEVMKIYPMNKEKFDFIKKNIDAEKDEIKKAAYFYSINRSSFSGSTLSGGMSKEAPRFNESNIKNILNIDYKNISVENKSFEHSILENKEKLIFADPPYYISNNLYGNNGDMHKDFNHILLSQCLKQVNKFILCYNDCEFIRQLYKDYEIIEVDWKYGMNKNKKSSEIIIKNF